MNHLKKYIDNGQMSVRQTVQGKELYNITCYTKDQFFNHEWDDISINHRGRIYRDSDNKCINNPFPKIFNLNEQPSTNENYIIELMKTEKYEVLDKLNGHLTIISPDLENDVVLVSTKGSFGGDLAVQDYELASQMGIIDTIKRFKFDITFMFECIAEYDKHLWYDQQVKKYYPEDNNFLVLIGAIDNKTGESYDYDKLYYYAYTMNIPLTNRYVDLETGELDCLYDHKGIEGYVFHFPRLNFRFKVKTKEYVTLHYMKEVNAEKFINVLYNSGIDNMYQQYDEELYSVLDAVKMDFVEFFKDIMDGLTLKYGHLSKREIAACNEIDKNQKDFLYNPQRTAVDYMVSKNLREEFKQTGYYPNTRLAIEKFFSEKLYSQGVTV